jgi:hypothetical protein
MFPCLAPGFPGFLLPAGLLGALLLSELDAGCGLLGRVALRQKMEGQRDASVSLGWVCEIM